MIKDFKMQSRCHKNFVLPLLLAVSGMLIVGLLLIINTVPADDTVTRYAPMARAFAEGNWSYAFHPHSGIYFSVLCGSIMWLTGLDGFRSCQLGALLSWGLAVIPFYFIIFRLWKNQTIALIGSILYLACSHLQRYVYDGLRDSGRSLGIFLLVLGLLFFYEKRTSWQAAVIAAVGAALLTMLRVDGPLIAITGIFCFIILDFMNNHWNLRCSAVLLLLFTIMIFPQLYLNYRWNGYPVPNSRYALILEQLGIPKLGEGI